VGCNDRVSSFQHWIAAFFTPDCIPATRYLVDQDFQAEHDEAAMESFFAAKLKRNKHACQHDTIKVVMWICKS
jgi:hypothetical protein